MRNAHGRICGAEHWSVKISDETVLMLRRLHEQDGVSLSELVRRTGMAKTTVHKILTYEIRSVVGRPTAKDMVP